MDAMNSVKMGEDHCPSCGQLLDAATGVTGAPKPIPGDLSVCIYCTEFLIFQDDLKLRQLTDDDIKDIGDENLQSLYEARRHIHNARMVK